MSDDDAARQVVLSTAQVRYAKAMDSIYLLGAKVKDAAWKGLVSERRSWLGELRPCWVVAEELEKLSAEIKALAIEAQIAVDDEIERKNP